MTTAINGGFCQWQHPYRFSEMLSPLLFKIVFLAFVVQITLNDQCYALINRWWHIVPNGIVDSFKQLIEAEVVLPGHILQCVKCLCGTPHTLQTHVHECLQQLWITIQKFFNGNIG